MLSFDDGILSLMLLIMMAVERTLKLTLMAAATVVMTEGMGIGNVTAGGEFVLVLEDAMGPKATH